MEKIRQYIQKTAVPHEIEVRYSLSVRDIEAFADQYFSGKICNDRFDLLMTAFSFGFARGYKAATNQAKKRKR